MSQQTSPSTSARSASPSTSGASVGITKNQGSKSPQGKAFLKTTARKLKLIFKVGSTSAKTKKVVEESGNESEDTEDTAVESKAAQHEASINNDDEVVSANVPQAAQESGNWKKATNETISENKATEEAASVNNNNDQAAATHVAEATINQAEADVTIIAHKHTTKATIHQVEVDDIVAATQDTAEAAMNQLKAFRDTIARNKAAEVAENSEVPGSKNDIRQAVAAVEVPSQTSGSASPETSASSPALTDVDAEGSVDGNFELELLETADELAAEAELEAYHEVWRKTPHGTNESAVGTKFAENVLNLIFENLGPASQRLFGATCKGVYDVYKKKFYDKAITVSWREDKFQGRNSGTKAYKEIILDWTLPPYLYTVGNDMKENEAVRAAYFPLILKKLDEDQKAQEKYAVLAKQRQERELVEAEHAEAKRIAAAAKKERAQAKKDAKAAASGGVVASKVKKPRGGARGGKKNKKTAKGQVIYNVIKSAKVVEELQAIEASSAIEVPKAVEEPKAVEKSKSIESPKALEAPKVEAPKVEKSVEPASQVVQASPENKRKRADDPDNEVDGSAKKVKVQHIVEPVDDTLNNNEKKSADGSEKKNVKIRKKVTFEEVNSAGNSEDATKSAEPVPSPNSASKRKRVEEDVAEVTESNKEDTTKRKMAKTKGAEFTAEKEVSTTAPTTGTKKGKEIEGVKGAESKKSKIAIANVGKVFQQLEAISTKDARVLETEKEQEVVMSEKPKVKKSAKESARIKSYVAYIKY
ncbi:uncharacterized protein LY89DRAFT_739870 [Mollisia scopiformis]|uniref:Uncharacterized protein n=1 Tax=Mollisia scopiformis TaxID=149040 RepID=A0A194WSE7_MOLSC|nr:uncharacterized protein LY89DRAFT_739870 [Mollisia scopiformis]KUJ10888.1 hypothetical protein LY89DRAFT_739870 [Mollisia scopiformis]